MASSLNTKKIWGWMLYDWAAQPYFTCLLTFIFGPYFLDAIAKDSVSGQAQWGWMVGITGLILAISSPVLGAIADTKGHRKIWMLLFSIMIVFGGTGLWWAVPGTDKILMVLTIFSIGYLGAEWSQVFANSMMPDLAENDDMGPLSANSFALGYMGGLIALALLLCLFVENSATGKTIIGQSPILGLDAGQREGTRFAGPFSALWFFIFIVPFFIWVPETRLNATQTGSISTALSGLGARIAELPKQVSYASFLVSSLFYRDALFALYSFGGIYAVGVLGWEVFQVGIFGIIGLLVAIPCTVIGGYISRVLGAKPVIAACIVGLIIVTFIMLSLTADTVFGVAVSANSVLPDRIFMVAGAIMGALGGILQATSRAMLVYQVPANSGTTEAFGLYALSGKATAFVAPLAIAVVTELTGNQRLGFSPVIILFLIGLCLLYWVKPQGEEI